MRNSDTIERPPTVLHPVELISSAYRFSGESSKKYHWAGIKLIFCGALTVLMSLYAIFMHQFGHLIPLSMSLVLFLFGENWFKASRIENIGTKNTFEAALAIKAKDPEQYRCNGVLDTRCLCWILPEGLLDHGGRFFSWSMFTQITIESITQERTKTCLWVPTCNVPNLRKFSLLSKSAVVSNLLLIGLSFLICCWLHGLKYDTISLGLGLIDVYFVERSHFYSTCSISEQCMNDKYKSYPYATVLSEDARSKEIINQVAHNLNLQSPHWHDD